jgi:hypothetical protein
LACEVAGPGASDPERKETVRPLLQAIGEVCKQLHGQDYWLRILASVWEDQIKAPDRWVIIDDVRSLTEANWIIEQGGHVVRVVRPETDCLASDHVSERSVDGIIPDTVVINRGDLYDMKLEADKLANILQ